MTAKKTMPAKETVLSNTASKNGLAKKKPKPQKLNSKSNNTNKNMKDVAWGSPKPRKFDLGHHWHVDHSWRQHSQFLLLLSSALWHCKTKIMWKGSCTFETSWGGKCSWQTTLVSAHTQQQIAMGSLGGKVWQHMTRVAQHWCKNELDCESFRTDTGVLGAQEIPSWHLLWPHSPRHLLAKILSLAQ